MPVYNSTYFKRIKDITFIKNYAPFTITLRFMADRPPFSPEILTKLSLKLCHYVSYYMLSVFCDSYIFGRIIAL